MIRLLDWNWWFKWKFVYWPAFGQLPRNSAKCRVCLKVFDISYVWTLYGGPGYSWVLWVFMGIYGCLGVYGYLWVSVYVTMGIWVSMGVYGSLWVFISVTIHGYVVHGRLWVAHGRLMGVYGRSWLYDCLWVFMRLYGCQRLFMGA